MSGEVILAIINGMTAEARANGLGGYTVAIGRRHEAPVLYMHASEARELRELLDEVIAAGDAYMVDVLDARNAEREAHAGEKFE